MKFTGLGLNRWPEPNEWAYLAGIIDGEGCVQMARVKVKGRSESRYWIALTVSQKNRGDLLKLKEIFGGDITKPDPKKTHTLKWTAQKARHILGGVMPFLMWKREQAQLGLYFIENSCLQGKHKIDRELAELTYHRLRELKAIKYGRSYAR